MRYWKLILVIGTAVGAAVLVISGVASNFEIEIIHRLKIEPRSPAPPPPAADKPEALKKPGPPLDLKWDGKINKAQ